MAHTKESWEKRLKNLALSALPVSRTANPRTSDTSAKIMLARSSADGEHEWDIEVMVCGHYEPAEDGGRDSPSYDGYMCNIEAFYFRLGKGWSVMELSEDELVSAEESLLEQVKSYCDDYGDEDDGPPDDYYADRAEAACFR